MAIFSTIQDKTVTTGGVINVPVDVASGFPECLIEGYRLTGTVTLSSDYELTPQGTAKLNQKIVFYNEAAISLDGNNFVIFGETVPTSFSNKKFKAECEYNGSAWVVLFYPSFSQAGFIQTAHYQDASVTLDKLTALTTGSIWIGSASRPVPLDIKTSGQLLIGNGTTATSVAMSGDATINSTGVLTIANLAITNAKVSASAAIAFSKLATLSSGNILVGSAGNVATSVAMSGDATISNTGVLTIADNSVTVAKVEDTLTYEVITLDVSFEAAGGAVPSVGDFKVKMPYPGTVTEIYAYCTKAIANTDTGTIIGKNNAGTTMTNGTITYGISDPRGTAYTVSPSANNTFIAGDILTFTTAKTTAGGRVTLSIKVVRS